MLLRRSPIIRQSTDPFAMLSSCRHDLLDSVDESRLITLRWDIAQNRECQVIWADEKHVWTGISQATFRIRWSKILTNSRNRTDSIYIVHSCFGFNLETGNQRLICRFQVRRKVDAMRNGRKCRPLPTKAVRGKFSVGDHRLGLFSCIDLGNNNATDTNLNTAMQGLGVVSLTVPPHPKLL